MVPGVPCPPMKTHAIAALFLALAPVARADSVVEGRPPQRVVHVLPHRVALP